MHIDDLHPASFRGASFLAPRDTTTEGRNSIVHDYPDQTMRYVEDNGAIPPCFDVTAFLHGKNLPGQLASLRSALMRPGPGVLRHPVFGTQFVSVDQTYSINHTQRDSGVIELSIKFITTGPPISPGLTTGIAAVVSQLSANALQEAFDTFVHAYGPPTLPYSIATVASNITSIASSLTTAFEQVSGSSKQIVSKAGVLAQNMKLSNSLWVDAYRAPIDDESIPSANLVRGYKNVRASSQEVLRNAKKIAASTKDLEVRKGALTMISEYNELAAFLSLSEAMASREYMTSDEVAADETDLETAHSDLRNRNLPIEQHNAAFNVFIATTDILERASVRLPRLTEIDAEDTPASVLAYSLYEQDGMNYSEIPSKVDSIVDLNPTLNPATLGKETSILSRVADAI